jgi:putative membrane protein
MKKQLHVAARGTVLAAAVLLAPFAWAADKLEGADASMLKDIAEANMAEVETGKIALDKSGSSEIKSFAQMMVDDHSKGLSDTKSLATAKGVELPDGPSVKHKAVALELKALKGDTFDSRYVKQAGVGDHETTLKLLQKTQAQAKDADLKALAGKMIPVVQGHLQHAQQLASKKK